MPQHSIRADQLRVGDTIVRPNGSRYRVTKLYPFNASDATRCVDLLNLWRLRAEPPTYYNLSSVVIIEL